MILTLIFWNVESSARFACKLLCARLRRLSAENMRRQSIPNPMLLLVSPISRNEELRTRPGHSMDASVTYVKLSRIVLPNVISMAVWYGTWNEFVFANITIEVKNGHLWFYQWGSSINLIFLDTWVFVGWSTFLTCMLFLIFWWWLCGRRTTRTGAA